MHPTLVSLVLSGLGRDALKVAAGVILAVLLTLAFAIASVVTLLGAATPRPATVGTHAAEIPPDHLIVMQHAAATSCGLPWSVLAAIAKIESNFGRNMATSSAGAIGYGQFLPSSWAAYGNGGDPYDYRDAIPAMARYLCANGGPANLRAAIWAYNHADWYVEQILALAARYGTGTSLALTSTCPPLLPIVPSSQNVRLPVGAQAVIQAVLGGAYPVTQGFGPSTLAGEPAYLGYPHFHRGIDLGTPFGTPIYAPVGGTAIPATGGAYGTGNGPNRVELLVLPNGNVLHFYHLSRQVAAGSVPAGALLGYTGNSGYSTGPHLHLEVRSPDGQAIPPEHWLCQLGANR